MARTNEMSRGATRLAAAIAAVLAIVVYANSLLNGFVYDDRTVILTNEAAQDPLDLRTIFLTPSWAPQADVGVAYRPLTTWTFALDNALHGDRAFAYHAVNVLAHAGTAALVVTLATAVGLSAATAGLAGALFAVHPIHTEAVANIVGRAEVLAAALALLALLWQRRAAAAGWRLGTTAAATAAYGLALLAKEHTIALAAVMPLADLIFADGGSPRLFLRQLRGRRALFYLGLALVTAGYLALRRAALGYVLEDPTRIAHWMNPAAAVGGGVRVLTALRVAALAVWLLLWPRNLSADYSYAKIPVATGIDEPAVVSGLVLAAAVLVLAVVLWKRDRTAAFWLFLALGTYAVVSNTVVPIGTIFAERLLYLPSVGCSVLAAMLLTRPRAPWLRAGCALVAVGLVAFWGTATGWRNRVWYNEIVFGERLVRDAPESAHAHHVLGTTYASAGRDAEALRELSEALRIDPKSLGTLYNAGVIYLRDGEPTLAVTMFRKVTDLDPLFYPAWINISTANSNQSMFTPALDAASRALAIRADVPNAHVAKGIALHGLGQLDEARAAFAEAVRLDPDHPQALLELGVAALENADVALATATFEHLVRVAPTEEAYRGLVYCYRRAGREADAASAADAARVRYPGDPFFAPSATASP